MNDNLLKQIREDIKFLLSFTPATSPDDVDPGLAPMFYVTGTYEGDVNLARQVQEICDRYDVDENIDDENEDLTEEY
jgi:hypothetical protein